MLNIALHSMNNLLSYFGLLDARKSVSEKDLPVQELGKPWEPSIGSSMISGQERHGHHSTMEVG